MRKMNYSGFFFLAFYFEIIADSPAVIRNNTERSPKPWEAPPQVAFCMTIVWRHNQEIDFAAMTQF